MTASSISRWAWIHVAAAGFAGLPLGVLPAAGFVAHASGAATSPAGVAQFVYNTGHDRRPGADRRGHRRGVAGRWHGACAAGATTRSRAMPLAALFTRAPDAPPVAPPPVGEGGYEPIPGEITFQDFLAGLNPLHHLPIIGTIYREATGERIAPVMRVLGGGLFGGPLGMLSSAVMAAIDEFRAAPAPPSDAA
jgi:hypothetical protein